MKNIIITGTSRGIGAHLVKLLAEEGHQVIALSRTPNAEFSTYKNVHYYSVDLADTLSIDTFAKEIAKHYDKIDTLIHNAGAITNKPFSSISAEEWLSIYQVNVFAVAMLNQKVIPMMTHGAHIVTISSMGGIQGSAKFPGLAAYSSSKGAVITLSELLAEEYKEQGISFNVLALGAVQTEMLQEAFPGYKAPINPDEMAVYIKDFALNAHKYINGKTIQVSTTTP